MLIETIEPICSEPAKLNLLALLKCVANECSTVTVNFSCIIFIILINTNNQMYYYLILIVLLILLLLLLL